jgi:hypothetical protein
MRATGFYAGNALGNKKQLRTFGAHNGEIAVGASIQIAAQIVYQGLSAIGSSQTGISYEKIA